MKVLVTGNAGFIGTHLCDKLLKSGHKVIGIDDFSGGDQNLEWLMENKCEKDMSFYNFDLCDGDETKAVILSENPEVVFHCAATAREGASHFDPINMVNRNIVTYTNTLEACIKAKSFRRFVLFSSMAVYGSQLVPFSEDMPKKPVDLYAQCKVFMEDSIKDLSDAHDFEYVIARPHNVYGEGQSMSDKYRNVVMLWINSLLRKEKIYIYGDGSHKRAFSYIGDSIDSYIKCGLQVGLNREIINIGGSKEYTLNELCDIVLQEFFETRDIKDLKKCLVEYLPDRFKEVAEAWCSTEKSERLLSFREKTSLREGIKKSIVWAKEQGAQEWTTYKLPLLNDKCPKLWQID